VGVRLAGAELQHIQPAHVRQAAIVAGWRKSALDVADPSAVVDSVD
jgi:hypothetical protein